jgi:Transposase
MSGEKYIGLDVHQATISVAVMDSQGKLIMESILETKASTILEFLAGLRGTLSLTFEEGTWAAWLYDLLKPHVAKLVVCNPRKNALLKQGNKSDKLDARQLADRLRLNDLKSVYHGEAGVRMLRELARSYLTVVKDLSRVMNRLKALYRSWAIPCAGRDVYYTRHRSQWLEKIPLAGTRRRAEQLYQAIGHAAALAPTSATQTAGGESQTYHHGQAKTDSVPGTDSLCIGSGADSDPASFPQQAPIVDLHRAGVGDSRQWGISLCKRPGAAQEAGMDSGLEQGLQP